MDIGRYFPKGKGEFEGNTILDLCQYVYDISKCNTSRFFPIKILGNFSKYKNVKEFESFEFDNPILSKPQNTKDCCWRRRVKSE